MTRRPVGEQIGPFRRLAGRADYRGWALMIDTDPTPDSREPHEGKRWTSGQPLGVCIAAWLAFHLRLTPRTFKGEHVLRLSITYIDRPL